MSRHTGRPFWRGVGDQFALIFVERLFILLIAHIRLGLSLGLTAFIEVVSSEIGC
jgi:hypothetical protein